MFGTKTTLLALATSALAQSDATSSCPRSYVTTSTKDDYSYTRGGVVEATATIGRTLTFNTEVANYTSTKTLTNTPDAVTVNETTGSTTALDPTSTTYINTCTSNNTVSAEYTSTEYTGSFSPSSVRTTCMPTRSTEIVYASGTSTYTDTETHFPVSYNTIYTPDVSTTYLSGLVSTPTTTVQVDKTIYIQGVTTSYDGIDCYPTSYTATASTTTTQSAACAPSNLINRGSITNEAADPHIASEVNDASACCQLCIEDEDCTAMIYVDIVNDPSGVCRIYNGTDSCGYAAALEPGNDITQAQSGCGFLVENIAFN